MEYVDETLKEYITPPRGSQSLPTISVIIPLYNFEKYIGECLDSILIQTFQNYEVIIVNDCSTDNSRQIVETYLEKFDGRLKIYDNEKNSGVSFSRNRGLLLAQGEYVFFMDADDMFTPNALEECEILAKTFAPDIINFQIRYTVAENGRDFVGTEFGKPQIPEGKILVNDNEELTLFDFDNLQLSEKVEQPADIFKWQMDALIKRSFRREVWLKLSKKSFLLENNLLFHENVRFFEDHLWVYGIFLCAKKIVHSPHVIYHHRNSKNSLVRSRKTLQQAIRDILGVVIYGMKWLDEVMNNLDAFKENPVLRQEMLNIFTRRFFGQLLKRSLKNQSHEIYGAIKQEFGAEVDEHDVLIAELITFANNIQKNSMASLEKATELLEEQNRLLEGLAKFTARIDIKLVPKGEGDFQIVSVSDERATVWKPDWLQKGGIGYQIQSYSERLELIAESTVEGQINFQLKGLDIHDPHKKTQRIPYWIDYTKLIVNGRTVFDKLTSAWHDKPYKYKINAKAGEVIKIQVEWLPHTSEA